MAKNLIFYKRTKYITVKYYYIKDLIIKNIIDFNYISSKNQKVDGLIKLLNKLKFNNFLIYLGFKLI